MSNKFGSTSISKARNNPIVKLLNEIQQDRFAGKVQHIKFGENLIAC
jgi:membrane carboxypeptidase/penicillin-binding protein PbpC